MLGKREYEEEIDLFLQFVGEGVLLKYSTLLGSILELPTHYIPKYEADIPILAKSLGKSYYYGKIESSSTLSSDSNPKEKDISEAIEDDFVGEGVLLKYSTLLGSILELPTHYIPKYEADIPILSKSLGKSYYYGKIESSSTLSSDSNPKEKDISEAIEDDVDDLDESEDSQYPPAPSHFCSSLTTSSCVHDTVISHFEETRSKIAFPIPSEDFNHATTRAICVRILIQYDEVYSVPVAIVEPLQSKDIHKLQEYIASYTFNKPLNPALPNLTMVRTHRGTPGLLLHPCMTANAMEQLRSPESKDIGTGAMPADAEMDGRTAKRIPYLVSWISVIGKAISLGVYGKRVKDWLKKDD
ncbi:Ubiquitin-like-conjugating enzyme Atg3/Atg10 like protein [Aduncisulcus paluster]|uniref:Ubiquitin-like-conjugating enzyme Atg3/Atg10 like protein n=1 Tax=Aduncisulcus paluster TaxID=2918883 RepID=A0ABQ5K0Q9_9EUKA|nr:Ubiquitin-like-conjugating enzyme Atg3/Atg10 like protein [Aduncisulcus paluster]